MKEGEVNFFSNIKIIFTASFMTSSILSSWFLMVESNREADNYEHSTIGEIIEQKMSGINEIPASEDAVKGFLLELSADLKDLNKTSIVKNSNHLSSDQSIEVTYEDIFASALEMFDFENQATDMSSPEDIDLSAVVMKYIEFAEIEAQRQYEDYKLGELANLQYYNSLDIQESVLSIGTPESPNKENSAISQVEEVYEFDLKLGDILYYRKPSVNNDYKENLVNHVSMVTGTPDTTNREDEWVLTEAIPNSGVGNDYVKNKDFVSWREKMQVEVIRLRKLEFYYWWFPMFKWVEPTTAQTQEMVDVINGEILDGYEDIDIFSYPNWDDEEWYCSELIWHATKSVDSFGVPYQSRDSLKYWILPAEIFYTPKTKVVSRWWST